MDKAIRAAIDQQAQKLEEIDQSTMHSGVYQAVHQLRQVLNQVEQSLQQRDYEKASSLGYSEVASEFVFLQRTLGGLLDSVHDKQAFIQDIALQTKTPYEGVATLVEQRMASLKPARKTANIDITIGEKSIQKLDELSQIRGTKAQYIVEHIVAKALKEDAAYWQTIEDHKPPIKARQDTNSLDEVFDTLSKELQQQQDNLF